MGLGANLGERAHNLQRAVAKLGDDPRVVVHALSPIYETAPVGGPPQPHYLNAVVALEVQCTASELLELLLTTEAALGRKRSVRWGPRLIDLDLLLFGSEQIVTTTLTVPHACLHTRAFVLRPLCDLAPDLVIPGLEKSSMQLLEALGADATIAPYEGGQEQS